MSCLQCYHNCNYFVLHRFQCKVCSKVCTSGAALKSHMVRHEEGGFECGICGKKLKREASYMVHIRKHTGEEPFE